MSPVNSTVSNVPLPVWLPLANLITTEKFSVVFLSDWNKVDSPVCCLQSCVQANQVAPNGSSAQGYVLPLVDL